MPLSEKTASRLAGLELNALNFTGVMPDAVQGARVEPAGTLVHDLNGAPLFRRFPLVRSTGGVGYVDIAVEEGLGGPLLATSVGAAWNERAILEEATAAAQRSGDLPRFNKIRFVAYSYPKIALQFLHGNDEVLMLEWRSWVEVPRGTTPERPPLHPGNFERWSLLDELPAETRRARAERMRERMGAWDRPRVRFDPLVIDRGQLTHAGLVLQLVDTRQVRYSPRPGDHGPCFQLRGQQTPMWCVAASVEMVLDFYRYGYNQVRLADELHLGTCTDYHGLSYSDVGKVVTVMEGLTSKSIDVTMHTNPAWDVFHDEIAANRPLVSFVPGHSRAVAGYTRSLISLPGELPFRGLLVYDPWPPTDCAHPDAGGVVTQWENFDTQTYQYAYSSVLHQV